jgi:hypothetical protein
MADEKAKHTPESVASHVVQALLKAKPKEKSKKKVSGVKVHKGNHT